MAYLRGKNIRQKWRIMYTTRCILLGMSAPIWSDVVQYDVHILNRSPPAVIRVVKSEEKCNKANYQWSNLKYLDVFPSH